LTCLSSQQIAGNAIGPDGIREIANALATNNTVTALWLKRNPLLPQGAKYMASMLSMNTTLQTLDLVNTGIRDEGVVAVMEALQSNPGSALKHLYLGSNAETAISGRAIGKYLQSGHSRLTSLFVAGSRLEDEGVVAIAEGLKVDRHLERLGLESARIGDVGAKALADALSDHPAMIMLEMGFRKGTYELGERANAITDDGLLYLGHQLFGPPEARRHNKIRSFDASNNKITKEGARTFLDKYVLENEQLLNIRLAQTGAERNIEVEHVTKRLGSERKKKYLDPERELTPGERSERDRVSEALYPKHIAEIYSIYRGKSNSTCNVYSILTLVGNM
jgi:Leucine Rich repeat